MRISTWIFITDLLPERRGLMEKVFTDHFVKKSLFKKKDYKSVFKKLKEGGVDGIELLIPARVTQKDLKRTKEILVKNNIPVLSIHQPLHQDIGTSINKIEKLFESAKYLEAKVIVVHLNSLAGNVNNKQFTSRIKALQGKYGIKVGMENDPKSPFSIFRKSSWKSTEFSKKVKERDFFVTFDTTHLAQSGGDILNFYVENKKRIINIHFSDYRKKFINRQLLLTQYTHLPLGYGELPVKELLKRLKRDKYEGLITLEIHGGIKEIYDSAALVKKALRVN